MRHAANNLDLLKAAAYCAAVGVVCAALLLQTGCQIPQWRIFQAKVDPKLAEKPPPQVEAERQAAKYIEQKSRSLDADPAQQISDIHDVAAPLSQSLGEPGKRVTIEDKDAIIARLQRQLAEQQKRDDKWRAFARKYAYTELEGTGVNLFEPGLGLGLIGLMAACILIPGFGSLVLFVIKRLRGTVQQIAQSVEEYKIEHPDEAAELEEYLSSAMDTPAKAIVKREKKFLDQSNLAELRAKAAARKAVAIPNTQPAAT